MEELDKREAEGMIQICSCGRYMTIISLSKDRHKGSMHFIDCLNDDNRALDASGLVSKFTNDKGLITVFMEEYKKAKPYYNENYNAVELRLDAGVLLN